MGPNRPRWCCVMQDKAAICLVLPVLRSENGVPVVATPKVAKVAKVGFGWPLGHPCCHWGHGAGGAPTWAATNSNLSKFGKFGEFIDLSKFSLNEFPHQNVGPNH